MPRRQVELIPGEYYHLYNRGANRGTIFFVEDHYRFFLRRFGEKVAPRYATVLAFCLLPNHYHFLLRVESEEFSNAMQAFGTSYSKAINRQTGRTGTLFAGRFQAKHVDGESYLVHLSRCIHLNPVEARLCDRPEDWEFSCYREYMNDRTGTQLRTDLILNEFSSVSHYRQFVEGPSSGDEVDIGHLLFDE